jgi:N-acetylneuraminic acid mutarotase
MKRKLLFFLLLMIVLTGIIILNSCKKEFSFENSRGTKEPPIAKAGIDQIITLPKDSATLNGSASNDPDGSITTYEWTKISGPASLVVANAGSAIAKVKNLVVGVYSFELKVTDNDGLAAKDTIQIFVNAANNSCAANRAVVNARLVPIGTLSQPRMGMVTATAGNKILFAGGFYGAANYLSTRVDIYDVVTNTWATAELSKARQGMTASAIGNKIFIAGGYNPDNGIDFSRVDIYDAASNGWSTAELSEARSYLASATIGDKMFFAGGSRWDNNNVVASTRVDIYNNTTNTWSTSSLSEARSGLSANTADNKIYFAGGGGESPVQHVSNKIDIYDATTDSWSTSNLNEGKLLFASIVVANKIYWAGGISSILPIGEIKSFQVEIRDLNTQVSTLTCLSQLKSEFAAVLKGTEIVFFTGAPGDHSINFDIYNTATDDWSIGALDQGVNYTGIIAINNKIYVAGGSLGLGGGLSNQVWLLEW